MPDWSMLLAAVTTIFLAAERQWTLMDWKSKRPDMLADAFGFGGLVFRQELSIRSYEIGADRTASIETLMNHLQLTVIADEDNGKLPKLPEHGDVTARKYVRTGSTSAPISIFENHELASMVLDYKRECGRDSVLQSHTTVFTDCTDGSGETTLQCEHLLCLESGHTIVKARSMWRP